MSWMVGLASSLCLFPHPILGYIHIMQGILQCPHVGCRAVLHIEGIAIRQHDGTYDIIPHMSKTV
jgi:hypothetical protein